jgi:ferredoxin
MTLHMSPQQETIPTLQIYPGTLARGRKTVPIVWDKTRCDGFGLCQQAAPEIYRLDDKGELHVHEPRAGDMAAQERARVGARACPSGAITIGPAKTTT